MSGNKTFPFNETCCGDHVVISDSVVNTTPDLINRLHIRDKLLSRGTSQESSCLSMCSWWNHFVVNVDFRESFFNEGKPPSSVNWRFDECWLMRVNWEQIVNSNILWSTLNIGSYGENTLVIIFSLIEHVWNEFASFGQSSNHSDKVIIAHRTLLQIMRGKSTLAFEILTK